MNSQELRELTDRKQEAYCIGAMVWIVNGLKAAAEKGESFYRFSVPIQFRYIVKERLNKYNYKIVDRTSVMNYDNGSDTSFAQFEITW